ncbi:serine hydrolase domain-containing protein [Pseudoalteromonas luteoviolacea]|uniref:Beta-lactamase n=1 Tax=Pseudoalteromonas luteoviolacea (strain 2ta16) TaxID=1353533 RepID=V4H3J7_PSEL2|nr:serine hydrolase [Pseudoalteromonas luteoviolacea]ESP92021.1 beta-lactamase [Pseudoalteromonas luteoviolacea 2ta16]KZN29126.1 hypothetical protein N483_06765 [Pseudoalteromonas luteoviolacea NCIMB 1944]
MIRLKTNKYSRTSLLVLIAATLAACGSESKNTAPSIKLSNNKISVVQNSRGVLSATVTDIDNNLDSIRWQQISGNEQALIEQLDKPSTQFLAPKLPGQYQFRITAVDKLGSHSNAEINVEVVPIEEVAGSELNKLMDTLYTMHQPLIANMALSVTFNDLDYTWQGATGFANVQAQQEMTISHPFRVASISKTITAAVTMKMIEMGNFSLDTQLSELLSDSDLPQGFRVADLHQSNGVKRGGQITIRQLLDQSTGIKDYISYMCDPASPDYIELDRALSGKQQQNMLWEPQKILQNMLERGLTNNLNSAPGEQHLYSDSNAVLLGIVLEKVANAPLHQLMEQLVFAPLAMDSTFMDFHGNHKAQDPADHYYLLSKDNHEKSYPEHFYANHNINAINMNTSFAWAGGGIVSTLGDLNRFYRAIHEGTLIQDPELRAQWLSWRIPVDAQGSEFYGLGLQSAIGELNASDTQIEMIGHAGSWGALAFDFQPYNIRIIAWASQFDTQAHWMFAESVLTTLEEMGYNKAF